MSIRTAARGKNRLTAREPGDMVKGKELPQKGGRPGKGEQHGRVVHRRTDRERHLCHQRIPALGGAPLLPAVGGAAGPAHRQRVGGGGHRPGGAGADLAAGAAGHHPRPLGPHRRPPLLCL